LLLSIEHGAHEVERARHVVHKAGVISIVRHWVFTVTN
jgi:hypothetical protein